MPHHCHATYCTRTVPPDRLMCIVHWRMVPKEIQRAVWKYYRPGQCKDRSPSPAWISAADAAISVVRAKQQEKLKGGLFT